MEKSETIQTVVGEFLSTLGIIGDVEVVVDETNAYRVHIKTEETGLLIGHHGRTLESVQLILSIISSKQLGELVKVYVNVNDYREKREETLHYMAQRAKDQAIQSGQPVDLTRLTPSERRIIHLALSGEKDIKTESFGEGERRILRIIPQLSDMPPSDDSPVS